MIVRVLIVLLVLPAALAAQEPEQPPAWNTSIGAGLSLTSGNRNTRNFNLSFSSEYDPKAVHVFKSDALYIRGSADGERTADKAAASARYERTIRAAAFGFVEASYLRDPFKNLNYSTSPVAGAGYHVVQGEVVQFTVDAAFGFTVESDDIRGRREKQAWKAGEAFEWNVSDNTKVTQKASGIWNGRDFGDALYQAEAALASTIVRAIEMKVSYRYDHKTRPPLATLKKGDSALFAALVYKIRR